MYIIFYKRNGATIDVSDPIREKQMALSWCYNGQDAEEAKNGNYDVLAEITEDSPFKKIIYNGETQEIADVHGRYEIKECRK